MPSQVKVASYAASSGNNISDHPRCNAHAIQNEDFDLVSACLKGKPKAQEMLYRTYAEKMFCICLRYTNDYHTAEDILQEGFIKVFKKIDQYNNNGTLLKWMQRIFINTAIDYFRASRRKVTEAELDDNQSTHESHISHDFLATEELFRTIQLLPTHYRTVFNLHVIEGYSHEEISVKLGISRGTSKSQLSRARIVLQQIISLKRA